MPHLNPLALVDQTEMWSENGKSADSEIGMSSAQCLIKRQHIKRTQAYEYKQTKLFKLFHPKSKRE